MVEEDQVKLRTYWMNSAINTLLKLKLRKTLQSEEELKDRIRCTRAIDWKPETDDIIDQAFKTIPRKRKRKQEQLSFELD